MSSKSYAEGSNNAVKAFSPLVLATAEHASNIDFDKTVQLVRSAPLAARKNDNKKAPSRDKRARIFRGRTKASY
ncbi:MAG: hypothetical protein CMD74_02245 [Gammaproteobacteria bacterium]|nr:hypothetical protein [Gammaproteobacteria bacterium]